MNLVEIIKACGDNGVSELEYGDIKLKFGMPNKNILAQSEPIYYNETSNELQEGDDSEQSTEELVDVEELKLSDPLAYERFLSTEGA